MIAVCFGFDLQKQLTKQNQTLFLKCYRVWWAPALRFHMMSPVWYMFPTVRLCPVQTTFNHYIAPNLLQHLKGLEITFYSNIVWVTGLCIIPPEMMAKFCFSTDLLNNLIKWGHHFSISGGGGVSGKWRTFPYKKMGIERGRRRIRVLCPSCVLPWESIELDCNWLKRLPFAHTSATREFFPSHVPSYHFSVLVHVKNGDLALLE